MAQPFLKQFIIPPLRGRSYFDFEVSANMFARVAGDTAKKRAMTAVGEHGKTSKFSSIPLSG